MEFSALIAQINELEETSREDKARYNEEVIRHQSTKAELENVQKELQALKDKTQMLAETVATLETKHQSDEKIIKQLKDAVKASKEENALLRTQVEKETQMMRERREFFLDTLDKINAKIRKMNNQENKEAMEVDTTTNADNSATVHADVQANQDLVKSLQADLEEARKKEGIATEQLQQREQEIKSLTEEFQKLDEYCNSVIEILQSQQCPHCGKHLREQSTEMMQ